MVSLAKSNVESMVDMAWELEKDLLVQGAIVANPFAEVVVQVEDKQEERPGVAAWARAADRTRVQFRGSWSETDAWGWTPGGAD